MDKTAAEKIAHEYYNTGIEVALQQAGLVKEANQLSTGRRLARMLGLGTAGALAPAAAAARGGATALGKAELEMLQKLMAGEGKAGLQAAKGILPGAKADAAALMSALKGTPVAELSDKALAAKAGIPDMFTGLMH
jgi:hypothetical protein